MLTGYFADLEVGERRRRRTRLEVADGDHRPRGIRGDHEDATRVGEPGGRLECAAVVFGALAGGLGVGELLRGLGLNLLAGRGLGLGLLLDDAGLRDLVLEPLFGPGLFLLQALGLGGLRLDKEVPAHADHDDEHEQDKCGGTLEERTGGRDLRHGKRVDGNGNRRGHRFFRGGGRRFLDGSGFGRITDRGTRGGRFWPRARNPRCEGFGRWRRERPAPVRRRLWPRVGADRLRAGGLGGRCGGLRAKESPRRGAGWRGADGRRRSRSGSGELQDAAAADVRQQRARRAGAGAGLFSGSGNGAGTVGLGAGGFWPKG